MSRTTRPNRVGERDDYQTPIWCVEALLKHGVVPRGRFLEPCKGVGNILETVRPYVSSVDWCEIAEGRDFLEPGRYRDLEFDWSMSNPPFSLARRFIDEARRVARNVAFLLRVNFLGSKVRQEWWNAGRLPTALDVLATRPMFKLSDGSHVLTKSGKPGTDATEYAWFVWSEGHRGIHVI